MTIILSLQARKGGCTKTTISVNLGAALALADLKVLVVDSDGQGNATQALGLVARDDFYNLIIGDAEFADLIRPVPQEFTGRAVSLSVLSADDGQRLVDSDPSTPSRIYERFQELRGIYDVVIGDTSPGATETHSGWYYASDFVLLPTLCETLSVDSLDKTLEFIARAADVGREAGYPAARVLGILPNRYSTGVKNSQYNLGLIAGRHGRQYPVFERIRDGVAWETAMRQRRSIYNVSAGLDRRLSNSIRDARKEFRPVVDAVIALVAAQEAGAA